MLADGCGWAEIQAKVGRSHGWLQKCYENPEFQARIGTIVADYAAVLKAKGIAEAQARIDDHVDLHNRMRQVIEERAASPDFADVPGGQTGLLAHNIKVVGGGAFAERVDVYEVDTGLISAINANKKQVAQERGQWAEKREVTGKDGGPIKGEMSIMDLVLLAAEAEE